MLFLDLFEYMRVLDKGYNYKPFVKKNRGREIQNLIERDQWFHYPGKENPAYILSRSIPVSYLVQNSLCYHGPLWLSKPSEFWPSKIEIQNPIGDLELRKEFQIIQNKCAVYDFHFVLDLNKYSDLHKKILTIREITWQFIAPHAPWWGGFYEQLMKSVKEPLKKILSRMYLSFEEMTIILAQIELILNHRPLTFTSNDLNEPLPLSPAYFLLPG
ncbi:integrase catalytic domain-containing protein [Nephila pilipes]|uniref:Integrase catalytic domain-containing protein n=1 Tax=Nephila pilipes TaxID=299642 RepID=A0A8X6R313_NEPPI|nr:integrase catalytic domain-containing protein [Nephila pilipes]